MKYSGDNVFGGAAESALVGGYLYDQDFAANTHRSVKQDLRKFTNWFSTIASEIKGW